MTTHEQWEQARAARDRCAVACTRALLAGNDQDRARYAAEFAMMDAEMQRLEGLLDNAGA